MQGPEPDPIIEHEDFYQNTHRLMARLRAESPVHRTRLGGEGSGYGWLVTRYADVKIASSAPEPTSTGRWRITSASSSSASEQRRATT